MKYTTLAILILLLCPTVSIAAAESFTVAEAIEQHNADGPTVSYTAQLQERLNLPQVGFYVEDTAELYTIESGFITRAHSGTGLLIHTNTYHIKKLSKYIEDGQISRGEMLKIGFMYARSEKSDNAPSLIDVWRAM